MTVISKDRNKEIRAAVDHSGMLRKIGVCVYKSLQFDNTPDPTKIAQSVRKNRQDIETDKMSMLVCILRQYITTEAIDLARALPRYID